MGHRVGPMEKTHDMNVQVFLGQIKPFQIPFHSEIQQLRTWQQRFLS